MNNSCLDCLYCKMIKCRTMLRCSMKMWKYPDEKERQIKLRLEETINGNMKDRGYFKQANKCPEFSSMIE